MNPARSSPMRIIQRRIIRAQVEFPTKAFFNAVNWPWEGRKLPLPQ